MFNPAPTVFREGHLQSCYHVGRYWQGLAFKLQATNFREPAKVRLRSRSSSLLSNIFTRFHKDQVKRNEHIQSHLQCSQVVIPSPSGGRSMAAASPRSNRQQGLGFHPTSSQAGCTWLRCNELCNVLRVGRCESPKMSCC